MKKVLEITLIIILIIILTSIFFRLGYLIAKHDNLKEIPNNINESDEIDIDEAYADYENKIAKRTVNNVTVTIKEGTLTKTGATIIIIDKNEIPYEYEQEFRIDIKKNGIWEEMTTIVDTITFNKILYNVKNEKAEIKIDWSKIYGELEKGEYRLVKKAGIGYIYTEFTI